MAYSSTNPLRSIAVAGLTDGKSVWWYASTHVHGDIEASNFFTGVAGYGGLGVKEGDLLVNAAASSAVTWHQFTSLTTSTGVRSSQDGTVSVAST